jgi:tRNA(Ile)-lysidine synthase
MVEYMVNYVLRYIEEMKMLLPGDRVIIGVSGGADSVCLLHVLLKIRDVIPITIYVIHIEHGIRGLESKKDAEFVEQLALKHKLTYKEFSYDVLDKAKKTGLGTEEMGRILRYQAFYMACKEYNGNKIAVAHNKNDNVETALLNLFRGSGLKGLSGIPSVRDQIIRPLLCVERREIEEWLALHEIEYRTDQTNLEDDYTRNKLRLNVIPYVQENINKKAVTHIDQATKIIYEAWEYLEEQTDKVYRRCVEKKQEDVIIKMNEILHESDIIKKNIIRKCIGNFNVGLKDITNVHIESILALFDNNAGKSIHLPNTLQVRRSYDKIVFTHHSKKTKVKVKPISIQVPGSYQFQDYQFEFSLQKYEKNQIIPEKIYTKWIDYDKIGNDLRLKTRETGDYLVINSCGGTKKLKAYLIDEKIEKEKRDSIPLLSDNNHVIWVVGYRISEEYKVDEHTKRVLKVQVNGGEGNG